MEKVLVVKTEKLAKFISGRTGLLTEDREAMLDIIINEHEFIDRPAAEEDPSYKQIIPYVVLTRKGLVFATRRLNKGGESRLHGKVSIGIGGHINPVDETDRRSVLMKGLERELDEEVYIQRRGELVPQGFINDDGNGVGAVHLGLCFSMEVEGEVSVKETEKLSGGWMSLQELRGEFDNMETWSQIALAVAE
ncbi:MAG TPA: hypothetical protein IAC00_03175 [Candidatus Limivicinus faecipullorum]|nr:hypothetical protein [Candidatus Limivicinus faecipullorum]